MSDKQAKLLAALRKRPSDSDVPAPPLAPAEPGGSTDSGTLKLRKSSRLYEEWVAAAGGVIKGSQQGGADGEVVVPLWLLKQSNDEQMTKLFDLLRKLPSTIHWYLHHVVFPTYMQHQRTKLSASGQELGGAMLFPNRIGFSGTPSDLLPLINS